MFRLTTIEFSEGKCRERNGLEIKLMKNQRISTWGTFLVVMCSGAFWDIPFKIKNEVWHLTIPTRNKEASLVGFFEFRGGTFLSWEFFSTLIIKWHERPPALSGTQVRKVFYSRSKQEYDQAWHLSYVTQSYLLFQRHLWWKRCHVVVLESPSKCIIM